MNRLFLFGLFLFLSYPIDVSAQQPVDLVNPLMGTESRFELSHGNTYPAIARPWGMNFWTPQTAPMGDGWQYAYGHNKIRGFKQTHQPSPWMNDYGQFSIMPVTGKLVFDENEREGFFSHMVEIVKPYYYQTYLPDYDVLVELTPTERAARFRFTFPDSETSYILVDAFDQGSYVKIIPHKNQVIGYSTRNSGGVPDNFRNYFVLEFDKPFEISGTWSGKEFFEGKLENSDEHVGAVIGFSTQKGEIVNVKVASSFISHEQALLNLNEIGSDDFETIKAGGREIWNRELSRIKVEGGTEEQKRIFYSTLYRTLLFPRMFYEYDENGNMMHYSPYNGKVLPGYMFTDNGFWDTFRAVFPFFNLMYPSMNDKFQAGLVNTYLESGFLPEWASPGHRNVMIGNNSATLVADAWLKGRSGYDIETLFEGLLHGTRNVHPQVDATGRLGHQYYNELGYVPIDVGINESAARTLEYAFADWTIWRLAKALDRPQEEIDLFAQRAMNYKNLFDPTHNLMRGKNKNGSFEADFNPFKWGGAFTEGNSWHYTWSVFHDIQGLVDLMGGEDPFVAMLDSVFTLPPIYDDSYYGFRIHEILEMQIMNMGQYAHGNQPIQHMTYLYNYAGQPWKTQYRVREVMEKLYKSTPDGYCGDEDNGQTSAWYVFSAMGFYPVTPASDEYIIGSPLFDKMTIGLQNGNTLVIEAHNNGPENPYIQSMRFNGQPWNKNYVNYFDLMEGGHLEFDMSATPNKNRGVEADALPYSFSRDR